MSKFNEKITNFKIYSQNVDDNIIELSTINNSDYMPFSRELFATFDLLKFESGIEYNLHLTLENEKGERNIIYVARYTPKHEQNIEDVTLSSSKSSIKFTLTIVKEGTYKISLSVFRPDKSQDEVLHSISRYYYFG